MPEPLHRPVKRFHPIRALVLFSAVQMAAFLAIIVFLQFSVSSIWKEARPERRMPAWRAETTLLFLDAAQNVALPILSPRKEGLLGEWTAQLDLSKNSDVTASKLAEPLGAFNDLLRRKGMLLDQATFDACFSYQQFWRHLTAGNFSSDDASLRDAARESLLAVEKACSGALDISAEVVTGRIGSADRSSGGSTR